MRRGSILFAMWVCVVHFTISQANVNLTFGEVIQETSEDLMITYSVGMPSLDVVRSDSTGRITMGAPSILIESESTLISNINPLQGVIVYPNPANRLVNIEFAEDGPYTTEVYDQTGRKMLDVKSDIGVSHESIDVRAFLPGQYLLQIVNDDGAMAIFRIVKL